MFSTNTKSSLKIISFCIYLNRDKYFILNLTRNIFGIKIHYIWFPSPFFFLILEIKIKANKGKNCSSQISVQLVLFDSIIHSETVDAVGNEKKDCLIKQNNSICQVSIGDYAHEFKYLWRIGRTPSSNRDWRSTYNSQAVLVKNCVHM